MTCKIISFLPIWYLAIVFVGIPALAMWGTYKFAYATGRWDQRGDDLEQFVETRRLEYGWKKL